MSFETEANEAIREMIDLMGSEWTWNGITFSAVQGENLKERNVELYGRDLLSSFSIHALIEDIGLTLPKAGELIADSNAVEYRITGVAESQGNPSIEIRCESKTR